MKSARAFDVLGAAYAEAGQFKEAVFCAENAMALLRDRARQPEALFGISASERSSDPLSGPLTVEAVQGRMALYRDGKPFRAYGQPPPQAD